VERFRNASTSNGERVIDEVLVTDTLPLRRGKGDLITVISVERLLAEAIRRIAQGGGASLRELLGFCGAFDN
jgi:phosphoribosylpyrophosphate synthetase